MNTDKNEVPELRVTADYANEAMNTDKNELPELRVAAENANEARKGLGTVRVHSRSLR